MKKLLSLLLTGLTFAADQISLDTRFIDANGQASSLYKNPALAAHAGDLEPHWLREGSITVYVKIDELLTEAQDKVGEEFEGVVLDKTEEGLMVHVSDLDELKNFGIRDALKAIFAGLIGIASAIVTVAMFLKLCDAFKTCRSPFDEPVIKRMNIFAWTLIVCAVVGAFAKGAVSAALAGLGKMSFDLSLTPIFTALVVFFLCMVFRYGAQLQREADETL